MRAGPLNKWVSLANAPTTTPDSDGFYSPLTPARVPVAIETLSPGNSEGRTIQHLVRMRYHDQVTLETQITFGTRTMYVKGIQNVNQDNIELRLLCEEVQ